VVKYQETVISKGEHIMVTVTICCPHCGSEDLIRNGHASNGKQKYRCKACKRQSRENPALNGYTEERREEIIKSYQERSSLRGLTRTFGVARNTVSDWLKKSHKIASSE
jgi:transposase-like protein